MCKNVGFCPNYSHATSRTLEHALHTPITIEQRDSRHKTHRMTPSSRVGHEPRRHEVANRRKRHDAAMCERLRLQRAELWR
eukprot:2077722-Prymnesium_polylepis.2